MKHIWTVMKKEFLRFFKDRRLLATILLPGLVIYFIYSFLGGVMTDVMTPSEDTVYTVQTVNAPAGMETETALFGKFEFTAVSTDKIEEGQGQVRDESVDLLVVFPENFSFSAPDAGANVAIYFNSVSTNSTMAYQLISSYLSIYQYDAAKFTVAPMDTATEEDASGMLLSMVGPMLVLAMLMSGCISIAPESIAGEKERGSFATMLVTPVKRSHIAIGKILSLSAIALLGGVCSFAGIVLSLPKLLDGQMELGAVSYTFADYAMLLGVVLSTVLIMVTLVSIVSTLAKSVKEAAAMVGPLSLVSILFGFATMLLDANAWWCYLIPILNSATALSAIFSAAANPTFVLITVGVNVLFAVGLAALLAKLFNSEKVMFNK